MRVTLSIADLPINIGIEELFFYASSLKFDGVEILPGIKTLKPIPYLSKLSKKYDLPILSVHHPFWAGNIFATSEQAFKIAAHFNALLVVHPLKKYPLTSVSQKKFMSRIASLSKKHDVRVTLENLPKKSTLPFYSFFSSAHDSTTNLSEVIDLCKTFEFGLTFDTSHLKLVDINTLNDFQKALPLIKNIHLSDHNDQKQHLTLGQGDLDTKSLLGKLKQEKYSGLVCLEISPRIFYSKKTYLEEIKDSLKIMRSF